MAAFIWWPATSSSGEVTAGTKSAAFFLQATLWLATTSKIKHIKKIIWGRRDTGQPGVQFSPDPTTADRLGSHGLRHGRDDHVRLEPMVEIPAPGEEPENVDLGWLTADGPKADSRKPVPTPSPTTSEGSYDIEGVDPATEEGEPAPIVPPIPTPVPKPKPRQAPLEEQAASRSKTKPGTVNQVWTRWAEWGPDVLRLIGVAAVLLVLLYFALSWSMYKSAFLILAGGAVGLLLLCYPLFITMERPIRITPEQAVNDYYAALSHSIPHTRRMWLLLSEEGRYSRSFQSFPEFNSYWNGKLKTLKSDKGGRFNNLVFSVQDFKSEKSAGLTHLEAKFKLQVQEREQTDSPGQLFPVTMRLVKGPDKMWYLEEGTMPEARS